MGTTAASVWGDFFHHPDDEAVLDNTLADVRWMYSVWEGLSGWKGFPDGCRLAVMLLHQVRIRLIPNK